MITNISSSTCKIDKIFNPIINILENEYSVVILDFNSIFNDDGYLRNASPTFIEDITSMMQNSKLLDFFIYSEKSLDFMINAWRTSGIPYLNREIVNQPFFDKSNKICSNSDNFVNVRENNTNLFLSKIMNDRVYNTVFQNKINIFVILHNDFTLLKLLLNNEIKNKNIKFITYSDMNLCSSKKKKKMLDDFILSLYNTEND